MFVLSDDLWLPQARGLGDTIAALEAGMDVCLQGPTGSGKTRQAIELFRWAAHKGMGACFEINRKLLVSQTSAAFNAAGLRHGIRAAGYEDCYSMDEPFQICSADTEASRVFRRKEWKLHEAGLVVVDEAHLQKTKAMRKILKEYKSRGAKIVLLTATPIGLDKWADELVISGTMQEYRDCKALVMATVKTIENPDMSKVSRSKTGEYVLDGKKKAIYTQQIVGSVLKRWKEFNPDARPTMLYAPGKPESVWLTDQFMRAGVNWCHVDATDAVVDGKRAKLTRALWNEIFQRYRDGDIKGLSSRYKLREGVNAPFTYCCILATPIGSLASYVQTVGRVLRYSSQTPDGVVIVDHGGNYLRHGSPNAQRPWQQLWSLPESVVSSVHTSGIKNGTVKESIVCPKCRTERTGGFTCPSCGHVHQKSMREVLMADGRLVTREGNLIHRKYVKSEPTTQRDWDFMYKGYARKKLKKSFAAMEAFFYQRYGYFPPRNLSNMPKNHMDWFLPVHSVPKDALIP